MAECFDDWKQREEAAASMIPRIGAFYRNSGVVTTVVSDSDTVGERHCVALYQVLAPQFDPVKATFHGGNVD